MLRVVKVSKLDVTGVHASRSDSPKKRVVQPFPGSRFVRDGPNGNLSIDVLDERLMETNLQYMRSARTKS